MVDRTTVKDLIAQHEMTSTELGEIHSVIAQRALDQAQELVETLTWLASRGNTSGVAQAAGNMASKVRAEGENLSSLISKAFVQNL